MQTRDYETGAAKSRANLGVDRPDPGDACIPPVHMGQKERPLGGQSQGSESGASRMAVRPQTSPGALHSMFDPTTRRPLRQMDFGGLLPLRASRTLRYPSVEV